MSGTFHRPPGWNSLTSHLLAVRQSLIAADITPDMLIIEDLGLSSMDLTDLAARIRAEVGAIDLLPWLARATAGEGTVASLAEFVVTARPEALAETEERP